MNTTPPAIIIDAAATYAIATHLNQAQLAVTATIYSATPISTTTSARHRHFWASLTSAPRRGLNCRAIMCAYSNRTPHALANIHAADQLADAGWHIRWVKAGKILHAKTWSFDHKIAIIGSHNLTENALHENHEISIITDDREVVAGLNDYHLRLWTAGVPHTMTTSNPWQKSAQR